jgi:hypothetical protein
VSPAGAERLVEAMAALYVEAAMIGAVVGGAVVAVVAWVLDGCQVRRGSVREPQVCESGWACPVCQPVLTAERVASQVGVGS